MSLIHICRANYLGRRLSYDYCPNCEKRAWFIRFFEGWHGWTSTCFRCGDMWDGDGTRYPRPFSPGWRKRNIENAKKTWRQLNGVDLEQWMNAFMDEVRT